MTVPSLIYVIQNNLLYVSASNLDGKACFVFFWESLQIYYFSRHVPSHLPTKNSDDCNLRCDNAEKEIVEQSVGLPFYTNLWCGVSTTFSGYLHSFILSCRQITLNVLGGETRVVTVEQNRFIGFSAALGACFLSGFAGIFFEKMLKSSDLSVWLRNIQLSLLSLPLSLMMSLLNEGSQISEKGLFCL